MSSEVEVALPISFSDSAAHKLKELCTFFSEQPKCYINLRLWIIFFYLSVDR